MIVCRTETSAEHIDTAFPTDTTQYTGTGTATTTDAAAAAVWFVACYPKAVSGVHRDKTPEPAFHGRMYLSCFFQYFVAAKSPDSMNVFSAIVGNVALKSASKSVYNTHTHVNKEGLEREEAERGGLERRTLAA